MNPTNLNKEDIQNFIEVEQKIIHLMLKDRRAIDDLVQSGFSAELFDESHKRIVSSIFDEFLNGNRLLTADGYRQILVTTGYKQNLPLLMETFFQCDIKAYATLDDIGHLKKKLVDAYVARKTNESMQKFLAKVNQQGYFSAVTDFVDDLQYALSLANFNKTIFTALDEYKTEYVDALKELEANPQARIVCDIKEIDEAMCVGFKPQHLTLFVADVGGHKTNIMLNIALNIWEQGHNVLFIPLEMNRQDLVNRLVAQRTGINYVNLSRPEMLTPDQWKLIEEADIWSREGKAGKKKGVFCILDADERSTVSQIRREIEKRAFIFKPKVVIIDYVAIMKPDFQQERNDLQVGEILKSLRFLGKKHGFHIITAAQMGRQAIKAMKEDSDSVPDSTSIRGSHEYSADSDTIFALMKPNTGEINRIKIYTLKARHGKAGGIAELDVNPACCRIQSMDKSLTSVTDLDIGMNQPVEEIAKEIEKTKTTVKFSAGFDLGDSESTDDLLDLT